MSIHKNVLKSLFCFSVFSLFLDSMEHSSTDVLENVTLPCLKVLASSIQKASKTLEDKVEVVEFFSVVNSATLILISCKFCMQLLYTRHSENGKSLNSCINFFKFKYLNCEEMCIVA